MSRCVLTTEESLRFDLVSSFRPFAPAEDVGFPDRGDKSDSLRDCYYSG